MPDLVGDLVYDTLPSFDPGEAFRTSGGNGFPVGNLHQPPYLKDIIPGPHVCDIHPLAINVMSVGVPAANGHSLFPKVGTRIAPLQSCMEGC